MIRDCGSDGVVKWQDIEVYIQYAYIANLMYSK